MSKSELISFLTEENGVPPPSNHRVDYYRDKVAMVMVNSLLDKLDPDQVTEILDRLNVEYRRNLDRRANNLRSHFKSKEANDEQTQRKQHNMLFLMMETVKAKSKTNVFQFPSAASSSGAVSYTHLQPTRPY